MSPSPRRQAWWLSQVLVVSVGCLCLWISLLTFDLADAPSRSVWPPNARANNWCGPLGAFISYHLFYYVGVGAYPVALLITALCWLWARRASFTDLWVRAIGLALFASATAAAGAMLFRPDDRFVITGPGGVFGAAATHSLTTRLETAGAAIMIGASALVGLLLAADELVLRFAAWLFGISKRAAPALARRGGAALATAGAAIASGLSGAGARPRTAAKADAPDGKPVGAADDGADVDGADNASATPTWRSHASNENPRVADSHAAASGAGSVETKRVAADARSGDARDLDGDDAPRSEDRRPARGDGIVSAPIRTLGRPPEPVARAQEPSALFGSPGTAPAAAREKPAGAFSLPPVEMLGEAEPIDRAGIELLCREKARILRQTLTEFRLDVDVVAIETGPVITVFELRLAPGIKVRQIASLTSDMARALKAPAVRVVAPLPGKNTIGIEVPNIDKERVRIRDLMRAYARWQDQSGIPLFLGKDASGQGLISDLTKMPHLLIAGTTGSGKSVCVSSIIMSILLTRRPDDVKLILVDPKVVELAMFKDIPHLMCPIVTEISKAEGILDWAATKMDERYALLAEAGVKDIRAYNRLGRAGLRERLEIESDEELGRIPLKLPYIVIVIDELADLMMTSAKEVEFYLCRLAQKSRAVGIHLIVSTQRPQANVVTGLIKANLPCRIAFRVSSRLDSRIVLDQNGGEVLMGQGDMLFLPPGSAKLVRAQGTYVDEDELRSVVKHVRVQGEPDYHPELVRIPGAGGDASTERDELFDQAVEMILQTGRGSVSLLQRRLTVGYSRASRLIDQMYDAGIVGEYKGSQAREVIMSREDWEAIRSARDREEAASVEG